MDGTCSPLEVRWVQGINKNNVHFIDYKTVCYPSGNFVIFIDIETRKQSVLQCTTGSIGAFTVNISSNILAFSNQKLKPNIYVYSFPGCGETAELKGGAQLNYSLIEFSHSGPYLASYSTAPDHVLTVWNWQECIPLCSSSESSAVFTSLTFNPTNWHQLCSSGETSLTVWNIEICDKVHHLKAVQVTLPYEDGAVGAAVGHFNVPINTQLSYYGPVMPKSAIAGLVGNAAETFTPKEERKPFVQPNVHCWSSTADLYVGCYGGHILSVNAETHQVTVLKQKDLSGNERSNSVDEESIKHIKTMALHKDGLYVAGRDGILRCCYMKGSEYTVKECWNAEDPIESICFAPGYKIMSVATNKGSLHMYSHKIPEESFTLISAYNEDLICADFVTSGKKYCLSAAKSGELKLWSVEDGTNLSNLCLNIQATAFACCPSAHYATVGSSSGHVYFIDVLDVENPRIVERKRLYHVPVQHLHFDQQGHFLLTGAANGQVFILDAKPSTSFQVLGYTEVGGNILSLSTLSSIYKEHILALALVCPMGENEEEEDATVLELFSLTLHILSDLAKHIDYRGMFKDNMIQKRHYQTQYPLVSAVMGSDGYSVYGFGCSSSFIYRYVIPKENSDDLGRILMAEEKVRGSQLMPGFICLSPHQKWMAISATDGSLYVRESFNKKSFAQVSCHSYQTGGIGSTAFSLDGHSIITTGKGDGTLVCLSWKSTGESKLHAAMEYGNSLIRSLEAKMSQEDQSLRKMSVWEIESHSSVLQEEERAEKDTEDKKLSVELNEQEDSSPDMLSSASVDATWLDQKLDEARKEETHKFAEKKNNLKKAIKELRHHIQAMMRENESLPDIEKLDQQEFNLDTEEQKRLQAESEEEVSRVRKEIEFDNLSKQYLRDVIKQECWDSMAIKGHSVVAFHKDYEVKNYPLKERAPKDLEEYARVINIKKTESVDLKIRKEIVEFHSKLTTAEDEETEEESVKNEDMTSLIGSLSDKYGGNTSDLYSQLELHSREEKINQIILLQNIIHNVKTSFNKEFDMVYKQKEQEISRVKERNQRIQEIMTELNIQEKIFQPTFTENEKPERDLTVEDYEIKVEKILTAEQKAEAEQLAKQEEEKRLAAQADNAKQRALNDMMGGVLEMKKEDILRMEVPQPAFLSKPEAEWTEDEKKVFKEYDKKYKELSEEKEKYRKTLEAEMKKIQSSIMESTQGFDEVLTRLFERKVKSEMVIYQEEMKISNLVYSLLIEEEMNARVAQLNCTLEKIRKQKAQAAELVNVFRAEVEAYRETYDNSVAEDKLLDRGFRKEFSDVPAHLVDQLYKLYKRRPRVQRLRTQTDSATPLGNRPGTPKAHNDSIVQLLKAMDELDTPENKPEGLEMSVWERFCQSRRSKIEYEQQVKHKALILAEMQAFLQKRVEEDDKIRQDTETIMQDLNLLRNEKMKFQLDLTVQFLLKQGQVEVQDTNLMPDFADALLLHRNVIEDLNSTIRGLGEQKIASMVESKDFRKGIVQLEWEHRKILMEMEDLKRKCKDIVQLRVSKELQTYLNVPDYDKQVTDQISILEETLNVQEKQHEKNIKNYKRMLKELERNMNKKKEANSQIENDLQEMLAAFSERKHIYDVVGAEQSSEKDSRYMDIVQRRKLIDLAKKQAQEIAVLRAEVDRLRMKTFPALVQMEY
ncbi:cilia- and flagella-associated protein 43 [Bombina bombina]|uniref:cilia- and flagella-associated protein 43 n=1 Tax=Bombina bombina TaxID=8345 RepID=UPI00235AD44E|nr:cilia- and flagella-associated protein 43 [Bombina bombina]